MAIASFCALQVLIAGIANGDMYGIKEIANQAAQVRHRGEEFLLACILLEALNVVVLVPLFLPRNDGVRRTSGSRSATAFLFALATSVAGTSVGLALLIFILRKLKLG